MIFFLVLMTFDVVEIEAEWLELLHCVMDFGEYGIVVPEGVPGLWDGRMTVDSGNHTCVITVNVYCSWLWNCQWVESSVL